jgi:hypothetical protein
MALPPRGGGVSSPPPVRLYPSTYLTGRLLQRPGIRRSKTFLPSRKVLSRVNFVRTVSAPSRPPKWGPLFDGAALPLSILRLSAKYNAAPSGPLDLNFYRFASEF